MRRDIGGHTHGNAASAIDQQVRHPRWQHNRLMFRAIIVGLEVYRPLVEVGQKRFGGLEHPHFGVAHGRRHIAVDRAEIALTIDQNHAHREGLRHTDHGVIDGRVTVRVIFTDHVTDDAGRLAIGPRRAIALLVHGKEDAAVHRLEAVSRVWQGAADNHTHRIVEIGAL